jgi:hypothetical protein
MQSFGQYLVQSENVPENERLESYYIISRVIITYEPESAI